MKRIPDSQKRVFWLYGLSGAGKTTLATHTAKILNERGHATVILDGDTVRSRLCRDLGFETEDRQENVRRTAELARLLCEQGFTVIAALMTPSKSMRQLARGIVGASKFHEVYVKCDVGTCARRDPKGLYSRSAVGEIINLPGKDLMFEEPEEPDLVLETMTKSIETCVRLLFTEIESLSRSSSVS